MAIASCTTELQEKKEKNIDFRTISGTEQKQIVSQIKSLYNKKMIKYDKMYFYDPGFNTSFIAVTQPSEEDAASDGCSVSLFIFKRKNEKWRLTDKFINLGQYGKYGNCDFEKNYLSFYTNGKNMWGYASSGWVGHQGFSNEYISLFTIEKGKIHFSEDITVMDSNAGNYFEDDNEYTDWESDYFFDVDDNIHFIVQKEGVKMGKNYSKFEDYVLSGNEFILKTQD